MVEDVERIVEDVEERIATHASECVVPVASAASALMMAGCLSTTDPTLDCRCGGTLGGSGGDRPDEAPVAAAMADVDSDDPGARSGEFRALPRWQGEPPAEEAEVPARRTPWWQRGPESRRFNEAMDRYPQEVLPHLRPPPLPSWSTPVR